MAQQQWNPTRVSFNDANQMMQGASQSYQNASDYFTKLGDSILAEERQKAVDAQNKLLFDQQQEERKYQQDVRAAKGVMAEGVREGPQTSFLDMNPWAEANGKKLEGMELFSTTGADGKLVHTDGAGRVITDAGEIKARQEQQAKLGSLLDTAEYRQVESRPEMLSRIIGEAKNKNLPITDLVAALEEARGAELTAQDKEKTAAQAAFDSKKKALSDLRGNKRGTYEKYNFEPLGTIVESTVSTSEDDEFGTKAKGRDAQAAWKEKKEALKGMTGTAAITSTQGLKDEVVGAGTSLASALGISDEDRVQKYMELTKDIAAPEVAANYARMYGVDKGLFSGSSLKNPEEIRDGLLQYVASLDTDSGSGGSGSGGHSTSLKSSTNSFTTKGGVKAKEIEALYAPQEKELLEELAAAEKSLVKANMTPAQKAAAKYATADKETREIMDWRYKGASVPGLTPPATVATPDGKVDKASGKTTGGILPAPANVKDTPLVSAKAATVVSTPKGAKVDTKGKMSFKEVNDKLEKLWDKDTNSGIGHSLARGIADTMTLKDTVVGSDAVPMTSITKSKAFNVLYNAGVLDKGLDTKGNAERLSRYLKKGNVSDTARPMLNKLYYDMKMQTDAKYREDRGTEELLQGGAGVLTSALLTRGAAGTMGGVLSKTGKKTLDELAEVARKQKTLDVPAFLRTGKRTSTASKPDAKKSAEWLDEVKNRVDLDAPTILRHGPKPPIKQGPAFRQTR